MSEAPWSVDLEGRLASRGSWRPAVAWVDRGWRGIGAWLGRLLGRTATRLALIQSVVVLAAFVLAGLTSRFAIEQINRHQLQLTILGEMRSMEDEFRTGGPARIPKVVLKRTRLWRGFAYRWTAPAGVRVAGLLPQTGTVQGWSTIEGNGHRFLAYGERLPDGSSLSVGQDLAIAASETAAVSQSLFWSGALGVGFCLIASYLFSRGAWRRIAALAGAAKTVADGDLQVRVPSRRPLEGDDLDALGGAFNLMLDRVEALVQQVRQVSSDIAHDLRTPLTRVRQRLEVLRAEQDDPVARREAIERIDRDLTEVLGMFAALLRLSEIENQDPAAGMAAVDLAEVAERVAEVYRPEIETEGRRLILDIQPTLVRCDGALIMQVVANLLDNALQHTPRGADLTVTLSMIDGAPVLSVADRGPGIAPHDRDLVLQRCRTLDSSRSGAGSGLGLAIVAAIARRHRARLALSDGAPGLVVSLTFEAHAGGR